MKLSPLLIASTLVPWAGVQAQHLPADVHKSAQVQSGLTMELFADNSQVRNVTTIAIDEQNRVYAGETHRWRLQVQEIRDGGANGKFLRERVIDDISCMTTADRIAMHQKWSGKSPGYLRWDEFTRDAEKIRLLEDRNNDGRAEHSSYFRDDFNAPLAGTTGGLIARDGTVYFSMIPGVYALRDLDGDGHAEEVKTLVDGFGCRISFSGHDMNGFAWGPDGKIYWSIGDRGYHVEKDGQTFSRPDSGAVFRCNPDGSEFEEYHVNLRNPKEIAFDKYGNLFTVDNNYDNGDKARVVYLMQHGDSGWTMGHQTIASFGKYVFPNMPAKSRDRTKALDLWMAEGIWKTAHPEQPAYVLPPITHLTNGPCGFTYNPGITALPEPYADHFLICNYRGSAARSRVETFTLEPSGAGFAVGEHTALIKSLAATDIEWGYDGKLYVSDYVGGWLQPEDGNLFTVFAKDKLRSQEIDEVRQLFADGFASLSPTRLGELLGHADLRVRQRAQFTLAEKYPSDALAIFTAAAQADQPLLKRLHAIWGLGQLSLAEPSAFSVFTDLLADDEMEVRANAARTLGNFPQASGKYAPAIIEALSDPSDRVSSLAALALANIGTVDAVAPALEMIADRLKGDPYLRHAATTILAKCASADELASLRSHQSPIVRRAAVVALRSQKSSLLSQYFTDPDRLVRHEAIRAAYDLSLTATFPALVEQLMPAAKEVDDSFVYHPMAARRAIYAAWKLGQKDHCKKLTQIVSTAGLDLRVRLDALVALLQWNAPPTADPVTAFVHPPLAGRSKIGSDTVDALWPLFATSSKDPDALQLLDRILDLAAQFEGSLDTTLLFEIATNERHPAALRAKSVQLAHQHCKPAPDEHPLWTQTMSTLSNSSEPLIRSAAREVLLDINPSAALASLDKVLNADGATLAEKQFALKTLAQSDAPDAVKGIVTALQSLTAGTNDPAIGLDIINAAELSEVPAIKTALAAFRASLPADDPIAEHKLVCTTGGNVRNGGNVFYSHGAAQCARCHAIDGYGGKAGPALSDIGLRHDADYLLRALISPGSEIAPGYGIGSITTTAGKTHSGIIMADDAAGNAVVKVGEELVTIAKSDIASRTSPISAMPPMHGILTKDEIRDVVAFLTTLDEDKTDEKHK